MNNTSLKEFKNKSPVATQAKSINNKSLSVATAIKRIIEQSSGLNLAKHELTNKTSKEIKEYINELTELLTEEYYNMEIFVLNSGCIPFESGDRVKVIKAFISFSKILLCMPGINEIVFPEDFTDEYTSLLKRTNEAITSVSERIEKIKASQESAYSTEPLEKNLLTLKMLKYHYITALEMPEPDLIS